MFDEKTIQELENYVYMLVDPADKKPFYIGKGEGNRVFYHINCTLTDSEEDDLKFSKIEEISQRGETVQHVMVRHGLTKNEAFQIEAALIDSFSFCECILTNKTTGYKSIEKGLMTTEEIKRLYNAQPLKEIGNDCVFININRKYERGKGGQSIYKATKETWTIDKKRLPHLKYVLSEYKGLIVEVFEVDEWYRKERDYDPEAKKYGQKRIAYGFNGKVAPEEIRKKYLNKSIAHAKKGGSSFPIRYNL